MVKSFIWISVKVLLKLPYLTLPYLILLSHSDLAFLCGHSRNRIRSRGDFHFMKPIYILIGIWLFWSCNNEELIIIEPSNDLNPSANFRSESVIYENAGTWHNMGLDSMFSNCTPSSWTPQNLLTCGELVADQLGLDCSYLFDTLHLNDSMELWIDDLYTAEDINDYLISIINNSKNKLGLIGLNNLGIPDTFIEMIENDTYDYDTLYDIYENTSYNWRAREGVEGFLGTLAYSTIYWDEEDPNGPEGVIQLDAAGFLIGWATAVYFDYVQDGNVYAEDQWLRIGAGVVNATNCSMGGHKWWKW